MNKWIITAESACDLSPELLKQYGIGILPITVIVDGKEYKDGIDITADELFEYVKKCGQLPKTAAVSLAEYSDFFTEMKKKAEKVLHFSISSKASSSYNNAVKAAEEVGNVCVIDTHSLSTGEAILMLKAHDMLSDGAEFDEVADSIKKLTGKVQTSFVVDTLDNLHKGGRCSLTALIGSKILKIHPSICEKDGALCVKKKHMGSLSRALMQYVGDIAAEYPSYDKRRAFVTHSPCDGRENIEAVIAKVKELFDFEEIIETEAGATISTHCGKNTIGLLFLAE